MAKRFSDESNTHALAQSSYGLSQCTFRVRGEALDDLFLWQQLTDTAYYYLESFRLHAACPALRNCWSDGAVITETKFAVATKANVDQSNHTGILQADR